MPTGSNVTLSHTILPAASGIIRDSHYAFSNQSQGFEKVVLLEGGSTNSALGSNLFADGAYWLNTDEFSAITPTPSIVSGQTAWRHVNLNNLPNRSRFQTVGVFTNAQTDTVSVIVENDPYLPSALFTVGIFDSTTSQFSSIVTFNWATGGTTGVGTFGATKLDDTRYQIWVSGTGTASGNGAAGHTRSIIIYVTGQPQNGNAAIIHHAQFETNCLFPTSPIPTVAVPVSRVADVLTFPITPSLPLTLYVRFINLGTAQMARNNAHVLGIGRTSTGNTLIVVSGGGGDLDARFYNASGNTNAEPGPGFAPALTDVVEVRVSVDTSGTVTMGNTLNGGTEIVTVSTPLTPAATWSTNLLTLTATGDGTSNVGFAGYTHVHVEQGIQSMDYMRAQAGI